MVFQSYAIWPHMTVAENVAYPLTIQRRSKAEIKKRVGDVLKVVGLDGLKIGLPRNSPAVSSSVCPVRAGSYYVTEGYVVGRAVE